MNWSIYVLDIKVVIIVWAFFLFLSYDLKANASFAFDGTDQLILNNFDATGGTSSMNMSQVGNELRFDLNGGSWNGTNTPGSVFVDGGDPSLLRVNRSAFQDVGDELDLQIINSSTIDLNVFTTNAINLPASPNGGIFLIDIDGDLTVNGALAALTGHIKTNIGGSCVINQSVLIEFGNLFLGVTGNISQTAPILGGGLALSTTGTVTLTHSLNNFTSLAADCQNTLLYNNNNDLGIGTVAVGAMSIAGLLTSNDNVELSVAGNLAFDGPVSLGTGNMFLDISGNITQSASISGSGIATRCGGSTTLDNMLNAFSSLAADCQGPIIFQNAVDLDIDQVMVVQSIAGIVTSNDDVEININGNLNINSPLSLGSGNLLLDITGTILQTASIAGNGLLLRADGSTTLLNAGNNFAILSGDLQGPLQYFDANALAIGSSIVNGNNITGITTTNDDITIRNNGALTVSEALNVGSADILLDVDGILTQANGITGNGLALILINTADLSTTSNDVNTLAVSTEEEFTFQDADDLTIGVVISNGGGVVGATTTNDNFSLHTGGALNIANDINLGSGNLLLDIDGNVSQTGALNAANLALSVTGTTTLSNVLNTIGTIAADNGDAITVRDNNDLTVGAVSIGAFNITGVINTTGDILLSSGGTLSLNEIVDMSSANAHLTLEGTNSIDVNTALTIKDMSQLTMRIIE